MPSNCSAHCALPSPAAFRAAALSHTWSPLTVPRPAALSAAAAVTSSTPRNSAWSFRRFAGSSTAARAPPPSFVTTAIMTALSFRAAGRRQDGPRSLVYYHSPGDARQGRRRDRRLDLLQGDARDNGPAGRDGSLRPAHGDRARERAGGGSTENRE